MRRHAVARLDDCRAPARTRADAPRPAHQRRHRRFRRSSRRLRGTRVLVIEVDLTPLPGIALAAIAHPLRTGERRLPDVAELPNALVAEGASFVTLERDGDLLGCIGALEPKEPLGIDVARHGLGAAFDDPRLPPCT